MMRGLVAALAKDLRLLARDRAGLIFLTIAPIVVITVAGLSLASLYGGLCLANAGLGAVHGFAAPAGGLLRAAHGALCAALLTGRLDATPEDGLARVAELRAALEIPGLSRYGASENDVPALVAKARVASSMKGNPIALNDDELAEIVAGAL